MDRKELIEILRVGLKAASPYNLQSWEFQFQDGHLLIFLKYDKKGFCTAFNDVVFYSLGALLENLSEGAKHLEYQMSYSLVHDDIKMSKVLCKVSFKKIVADKDYDIRHVISRYTNRKAYRQQALSPDVLDKIRIFFQGDTRKILDVTKNCVLIDNCALIEKVRISNLELNNDFVDNICFSEKQAQESRRGLDLRVLEVPFSTQIFLRAAQNQFFRRTIGRSILAQLVAKKAHQELLYNAPLLIAFLENNQRKDVLVRDWMDIQRIINFLHREGLSSHLIASCVDLVKIDASFFGAPEREILNLAQINVQKNTGIELRQILTLLRVGYADECKVKSLRVDPENLLLSGEDNVDDHMQLKNE